MDNLSHSVAGLAVGELVQRSLPREADPASHGLRRRMLLVAGWAASNFPDLDLVFTGLLPKPLGYLLHHRGHTHTLLYALPQALLLALLIWLLWPGARRLLGRSASARFGLWLAIAGGFLLHLTMDFLNSYGIHPFHPVDSRWFYGDMVFILEPVFWIAFGVPMAMMVQHKALRIALLALLIGAPLGFSVAGFLHWGSIAALLALAAALAVLQRRAGANGRRALLAGLAAAVGFVGMQGLASSAGERALAAELHRRDPGSRLMDASMTAFPANPLCWNFVSVERNDGAGSYRVRRGVLALAPALAPLPSCPPRLADLGTQPHAAAIALLGQTEGRLADLRRLESGNCHFQAWLRFARTPALTGSVASDVRFGSLRPNFSTIDLADFAGRACPRDVPAWAFPRADLLTPSPAAAGGALHRVH